jgi:hypothetical protein
MTKRTFHFTRCSALSTSSRQSDSTEPDECAKVIQKLSLEASSKKALQTYQELVTEAKKLGHTEQD